MIVKPLRVALGAAVIAAIFAAGALAVNPVPHAILAAVGGGTAFEREGGLRLEWQPPPGGVTRPILLGNNVAVHDGDHRIVIEIPGVAKADVAHTADIVMSGGMQMRLELETNDIVKLAEAAGITNSHGPVTFEPETWLPETSDQQHTAYALVGSDRASIEAVVASARAAGWRQPPDGELVLEHSIGEHDRSRWIAHLLSTEVLVDDTMLESASTGFDPLTDRPIVMLEFTRAGGERFGDVTERFSGHKFAIVVGREIVSDPVINGRIGGGRCSITMGGGHSIDELEADADRLVHALSAGSLPPGGTLVSASYVAPTRGGAETIGAIATAALAALIAALLAWFAVKLARPAWAPFAPRSAGARPWLRLATMLGVVIVVYFGIDLTLPIVDRQELLHLVYGPDRDPSLVRGSLFALGVFPVITAAIAVELLVLAVPAWRPLRTRSPQDRRRIAWAIAAVAIALALVQGYAHVDMLQQLGFRGPTLVDQGLLVRIEGALSLAGGTMMIVLLAALIASFGLGNGYAAIVAITWALRLVAIARTCSLDSHQVALAVGALVTIAALTATFLRWRIARDQEVPLALPSSGMISIFPAGGLFAVIGIVTGLDLWSRTVARVYDATYELTWRVSAVVVIAVGFGALWSLAFTRPGALAKLAGRASLAPPAWSSWWRATALSCAWLIAIAAIIIAVARWTIPPLVFEGLTTVIATATALDLVADWRGRRGAMVAVWSLHDAQHVELARSVLATGGVRSHVSATHVRALFALFGPWAPMTVYVARDDAKRATELLLALFDDRRPPPNVEQAFA